jgi:hypothetical protein
VINPRGDTCSTGQALDGCVGGVAIHPAAFGAQEDRSRGAFAQVQVQGFRGARFKRDGGPFAALAHNLEGPMPPLEVQILNIDAQAL